MRCHPHKDKDKGQRTKDKDKQSLAIYVREIEGSGRLVFMQGN